jgi:hypothetical protein
MSTDLIPSVWTSMIVAFQVIILQLSVKCRRIDVGDSGISSNYFPTIYEMLTDLIPSVWTSVWTSVIVAFQVIILIAKLSIAQNNNNSV